MAARGAAAGPLRRLGLLVFLVAARGSASSNSAEDEAIELDAEQLGKLLGAAGEEQREDIIDQMKRSYYEGEPEGRPLRDVRELEVAEARSLIKDLHQVLGDEASQTKLREARVKVHTGKLHHLYKQFDKDSIPTDQGPRVQMMHSLIPLVDRLAAGVFKKHRMPHGYVEAINACIHAVHDKQHVTRVSVADRQLRVDMERLSQVVLGESAPHLVGRAPELDLLAERFLDAGPAERARALREAGAALAARRAEAEARQVEVPESTAEYVTVMKAVLSHGVKFVEDKVVELSLKSFQEGLDESELEALKARIGILTEFLREQDHHRVNARLNELHTHEAPELSLEDEEEPLQVIEEHQHPARQAQASEL